MSGGYKKIEKKDVKNGFDKNKQNINRKGQPRKLVSSVLKELEAQGVERVAPDQVRSIYEVLLNLSQDELKIIVEGKDQPMLNRIVAKGMLDKRGFEVIERMIDRAHGVASKTINVNGELQITNNANIIVTDKLKELPLNLMIIAMVAAKTGKDVLILMNELAKSYYSQFSGFTKEQESTQSPIDIKNINYDWNIIKNNYENQPKNIEPIIIDEKTRIKELLK